MKVAASRQAILGNSGEVTREAAKTHTKVPLWVTSITKSLGCLSFALKKKKKNSLKKIEIGLKKQDSKTADNTYLPLKITLFLIVEKTCK